MSHDCTTNQLYTLKLKQSLVNFEFGGFPENCQTANLNPPPIFPAIQYMVLFIALILWVTQNYTQDEVKNNIGKMMLMLDNNFL